VGLSAANVPRNGSNIANGTSASGHPQRATCGTSDTSVRIVNKRDQSSYYTRKLFWGHKHSVSIMMGWDKALAGNGQPSRTGSLEFIAAVTSAVASASRKRAAPVFLPHTRRNSSAWRPGTLEVVTSVNYSSWASLSGQACDHHL
jgi:hypothetical protein